MLNLLGPVLVPFAQRLGRTVLAIAAPSFLGLGLQPPAADGGAMIKDARACCRGTPVLMLAPGLCILTVALCVDLIGDGLRDRLAEPDGREGLP